MPTEPQPVSLAALFSRSQTARRPAPKPAPTNQSAPSASQPPPLSTTNTDTATTAPSHIQPVATTSPLHMLTAAGIYPQPRHTTSNPSNPLPQPYVRPGPAIAGLLSHGFNPNTFIGELPRPGPTTFIGSNTTGRKKASIIRNTWKHSEAPTAHIIIYPFLSPYHRKQAEKHRDPDVQMGYPLPQSDIYSVEHPEVVPFREHMQKLDLCITYPRRFE